MNNRALQVLLSNQWISFASQFNETDLFIDNIERDFNRACTLFLATSRFSRYSAYSLERRSKDIRLLCGDREMSKYLQDAKIRIGCFRSSY